jgi:hypothetical protein
VRCYLGLQLAPTVQVAAAVLYLLLQEGRGGAGSSILLGPAYAARWAGSSSSSSSIAHACAARWASTHVVATQIQAQHSAALLCD